MKDHASQLVPAPASGLRGCQLTVRYTPGQPVVIDGRNLYEPSLMAELGIEYSGIGRSTHPVH